MLPAVEPPPPPRPEPRALSGEVLAALVLLGGGVGLVLLGVWLDRSDPDPFFTAGTFVAGLGGLTFLGGLLVGWLAAVARLTVSPRGGLVREALLAAAGAVPPGLILGGQLLRLARSSHGAQADPAWLVLDPDVAALGSVGVAAWLVVLGLRLRLPRREP